MKEHSKSIILAVLGVILLGMSIAYATLSTALKINGTANVAATTWNIHFANVAVANTTTITKYNLGTLDENSSNTTGTKISGLKASLNNPADKLVVNFDIVNSGTIDAKLQSFSKSIIHSDQAGYSNTTYTITCKDTSLNEVTNNYVLQHGSSVNCVLTLMYNENASNFSDDITSTITANWNFIQN